MPQGLLDELMVRVTQQVVVNQTIAISQTLIARLAQLRDQASTGLRILRPSDDPLDSLTVLTNRSETVRIDVHLGNIREARSSLEVSSAALQEVNQVFIQARQIAIEGANATNDESSYEALARAVDELIGRLLDVANTQHTGRYVFSGTATDTKPFTVASTDSQGRPLAVQYLGADERGVAIVSRARTVDTFYTGHEVFESRERGATVFTGDTGAAAGTGTDSATGQGTLRVRHTATTYAAGSGVATGLSSATGDTVLGPAGAHVLTLVDTSGTGASGTVALDGGVPVAFTNANTNLKVQGPVGEIVYLNTTAITPGFNGSVNITGNGTLSVDGGASSVALNFSSNQVVNHSATGAVTNVASTNIRRTGDEALQSTGTFSAFEILVALRDDLRNTRGLNAPEQSASLSQRLEELDRVRGSVLSIQGEQSTTLQNLDALQQRAEDVQLELQKLISDLESANPAEVILKMQAQQNLLDITLAAAARVGNQSLLDFLG